MTCGSALTEGTTAGPGNELRICFLVKTEVAPTDRKQVGSLAVAGQGRNDCLMGVGSLWSNEKVLEPDGGRDCTLLRMY